MTKRDKEIIDVYLSILKEKGKFPTRTDMKNAGANNNVIRKHFSSLSNLQKIVIEKHKKKVEDIMGFNIFNSTTKKTLVVNSGDKFFITTAVSGGKVNSGYLKSIRQYCRKNKTKLIILPIEDPAKRRDKTSFYLPKELKNETIILEDTKLNNNLFISAIKISAKQINPLTGLKRIGQRNGSCIYASPKQFMECVAISNTKIPAVLMTTGAITDPEYSSDYYFSKRTAYIAKGDHVLGGIVVEIKSDKVFYFRQVQADRQGKFIDLGKSYDGKKIKSVKPSAFIPGDWHSGDTSPAVVKNWYEVSKVTGVKKWIIHDLYNGKAISHHDKKKCSLQAIKAEKGQLNMRKEFTRLANDIKSMCDNGIKEIVIVKSNHDEWLDKWLESGDYVKDPYNLTSALVLAEAQISGVDPLKFAIEEIGGLSKKISNKIKWLNRDEDYVIAKIECGAHGDLGANGSRGTVSTLENAYGNCVVGHSHSPKIVRGLWMVGTTTYLKVGYNRGASGWANAGCLVYPNGSRQMIFSIYDEWRI